MENPSLPLENEASPRENPPLPMENSPLPGGSGEGEPMRRGRLFRRLEITIRASEPAAW